MRRGLRLMVLGAAGGFSLSASGMDGEPLDLKTARLAMPYSCTVENGALALRAGPERAFEITGEREQRLFTTCDPPFSNNCRSLTVYRFDVACGTSRVPWPSVVAAIGRTTAGDASMSKGHMVLARAGSRRSDHAPSCADRKAADGSAAGECLPWRTKKPIETLVLPQGFAPLREVGARLIDGSAPAHFAVSGAADVMALGGTPANSDLAGPGPYGVDGPLAGPDAAGAPRPVEIASQTDVAADESGGWSTSLSIYRGEEPPPELIVTAAVPVPAVAPPPASALASLQVTPWLPWLGAMGCLALAGVYLYRTRALRFSAPLMPDVAAAAQRSFTTAQQLARDAAGGLRARLAPSKPAAAATDGLGDPGLASALLQLKAMLARTDAAVSMLSTAAVLREVMQTDLAAIRTRLAEAESAALHGTMPLMKFAAQLRQIARDIDRVQRITESARRSFSGHA